MEEHNSTTNKYYYAQGERIALQLDPQHCAIDLPKVTSASLKSDLEALCTAQAAVKHRGMLVCHRDDLAQSQLVELAEHEALQPVYRHGTTLLLFLPEVRLEEAKVDIHSDILDWLASTGSAETKLSRSGATAKVYPISGKGTDALELANQLQEKFSPQMVQARMVRLQMKVAR